MRLTKLMYILVIIIIYKKCMPNAEISNYILCVCVPWGDIDMGVLVDRKLGFKIHQYSIKRIIHNTWPKLDVFYNLEC